MPVGLVYDDDRIVLDPDKEVQGAVRTVFELFAREGTAYGVVRRFQELGLYFPRRSYGGAWNGKLIWGRLSHARVRSILVHHTYAGVYVFGRYQSAKQVGPSGEIITRSRAMPESSWRVTIREHHEGYIDWDQFVANRHRLATNPTNSEALALRRPPGSDKPPSLFLPLVEFAADYKPLLEASPVGTPGRTPWVCNPQNIFR